MYGVQSSREIDQRVAGGLGRLGVDPALLARCRRALDQSSTLGRQVGVAGCAPPPGDRPRAARPAARRLRGAAGRRGCSPASSPAARRVRLRAARPTPGSRRSAMPRHSRGARDVRPADPRSIPMTRKRDVRDVDVPPPPADCSSEPAAVCVDAWTDPVPARPLGLVHGGVGRRDQRLRLAEACATTAAPMLMVTGMTWPSCSKRVRSTAARSRSPRPARPPARSRGR